MAKAYKILISGFEPFLSVKVNPTEILMQRLNELLTGESDPNLAGRFKASLDPGVQSFVSQATWKFVVLPVDYKASFQVLDEHIESFKPNLVLATGVADGRSQPELERIGINHQSTALRDNSGLSPSAHKISESGPDGLFCDFNVDQVVENANRQMGLVDDQAYKLKVSNTAGTYVCNSLLYKLLLKTKHQDSLEENAAEKQFREHANSARKLAERNFQNYRAGFLHFPNRTDEQALMHYQQILFNVCSEIMSKSIES